MRNRAETLPGRQPRRLRESERRRGRPPGTRRRGLLRGAPASAAGLALLVLAPGADAYRFSVVGAAVGGAADARRWDSADLPVRFRVLSNENLPAEDFSTHAEWRAYIAEVFDHWNDIETAEEILAVDEAPAVQEEASRADGWNTIGFSSYFARNDFRYSGFASWQVSGSALTSCDIELNPIYRVDEGWETRQSALVRLILHEVGHCLGLLHSVLLPMPFDYGLPELELEGFEADPIMSYGRQKDYLTRDDAVAASLLYPAAGFAEETGSLRGEIRFADGGPARFVYVQAIEIGDSNARAGPGAFSNEEGVFLLEGVRPGPVFLWVHSFVVGVAHGFRADPGEWEIRFPQVWVFSEAEAGAVAAVPGITLRRGLGDSG